MMSNKKRPTTVPEYERSRIFRNAAIGIAFLIVFLSLPSFCYGDCGHDHGHGHVHAHGHDHHHVEEPSSFKWSREANEIYEETAHSHEDHHHDHHSHGHHAHHAHSHSEPPKAKVEQGKWEQLSF